MSEALRQALAAGDHVAAGNAIMDAHTGARYNPRAVEDLHRVGRMTRAELNAPPEDYDSPVDRAETVRVVTRVRLFGRISR